MRRATQLLACVICSVIFITGCGGTTAPKPQAGAKPHADHAGHKDGDEHDSATAAKSKDSHDHAGWWCNEHGVPEEECAQCNSKVAAEFQKKGDWCKQHERPDSQCFKCHPELQAKFAAKYEAKYGKQPPEPEMN
jgi:hypothetical protein